MKVKLLGSNDCMAAFEEDMRALGQHSPSTICVYDVDYDPENGAEGIAIFSFGNGFDIDRVNIANRIAPLGARLAIETYKECEKEDPELGDEALMHLFSIVEDDDCECSGNCDECPEAAEKEVKEKEEPKEKEPDTDERFERLMAAMDDFIKGFRE